MNEWTAGRGAQKLRALCLSLLLFCVLPVAVSALEVPPPPTQWVTDAADVLSVTDESILNQKLREFEQSSGAQFIVYTIPTLEGDPVEDFTMRAVERWKVGQAKYDNGLVLFVFIAEKKVRVEVGYGLEGTITDAFSSRVIREQIAPNFQRGDYAGGLNAAADVLMAQIRKGEPPVEPLQPQGGAGQEENAEGSIFMVLVILFIVFFVIAPMFSRRRGGGGCGGCMFPFFLFPGGGSGITFGGGGFSGGGGFGGGGGFSGGGGGFGGGGATGGW